MKEIDASSRPPLPQGVAKRLTELLGRRDRGETLTASELGEVEALIELSELFALLRVRK